MSTTEKPMPADCERRVQRLLIGNLHKDPDQPRKEFDPARLSALGRSLKKKQHQPLLVYTHSNLSGQWMIADGERRWRAAELVGMTHLDCMVIDKPASPLALRTMQVTTNLLRDGMNPVELATVLWQIKRDGSLSETELAEMLDTPQPTVHRWLEPRHLAPDLVLHVESGEVCASVACLVASVRDHERQREIMKKCIAEKLTRDQAKRLIDGARGKKQKKAKPIRGTTPNGCKFEYKPKPAMSNDAIVEDLKAIIALIRKYRDLPPDCLGFAF